jgi:DNA-directed RNA polymerase subunit alpha
LRSNGHTPQGQQDPIEVLDLSVRSYNCLKGVGISTIGQIFALSQIELRTIRNLGERGYEEIRERLIEGGYMQADEPLGPFVEE